MVSALERGRLRGIEQLNYRAKVYLFSGLLKDVPNPETLLNFNHNNEDLSLVSVECFYLRKKSLRKCEILTIF